MSVYFSKIFKHFKRWTATSILYWFQRSEEFFSCSSSESALFNSNILHSVRTPMLLFWRLECWSNENICTSQPRKSSIEDRYSKFEQQNSLPVLISFSRILFSDLHSNPWIPQSLHDPHRIHNAQQIFVKLDSFEPFEKISHLVFLSQIRYTICSLFEFSVPFQILDIFQSPAPRY